MERIHRKKSHKLWVKDGDKNTNFFHTSTVVQRRRNFVGTVKQGQESIHYHDQIGSFFINEFKTLYSTSSLVLPQDLSGLLETHITAQENSYRMVVPTMEEVQQCVYKLHPFKAL